MPPSPVRRAPAPHLIADDQADVLEALRLLLKRDGYPTEAAKSPAAVIHAVEARDTTSGQEGLALLQKIAAIDATLPVVVMTAEASADVAVEARRRGARDFVTKPRDNPRLLAIVRNQIDLGHAVRAYRRLEQEDQALRTADGKSDRAGRFKLADTGTPFLDKIGHNPLSQQAKILRTIETGKFERVAPRAAFAETARRSLLETDHRLRRFRARRPARLCRARQRPRAPPFRRTRCAHGPGKCPTPPFLGLAMTIYGINYPG